jgi:hypothetical protein
MTPTGSRSIGTPPEPKDDARPLDFHHWLESRGMNPNRRRPLGRTAALLMDYRAYLERAVGAERAEVWFQKYAGQGEPAASRKPQEA